ncbi:MAG TPA: DUF1365 domain-containing protein [Rhizomicrobium sp.]|nr:DUF1365 domain-containing protein [Rhizomicrobium sp.]
MHSAIYEGYVAHTRIFPRRHAFRYRVFSLLLDLDEIDAPGLRLFGRNGCRLASFHDGDHGDGRPLREWVRARLAGAGIEADGPIRVLCYPRLFGFVFNPLSVWFCHRGDGALAATIYEVHNTFGERHSYVLAAGSGPDGLRQECGKAFYVSPFLSQDCRYEFRVRPPAEDVVIAIRESEGGAPVLDACFAGRRKALTDRNLALALLRHPLMTLKVVAAIHYEALRLWLKRVPAHAHLKTGAPP